MAGQHYRMRLRPSLALLPLLAGCTTPRAVGHPEIVPTLPTAEEVSAYVASYWDHVGKTFARFSNRQGESAELVEVSDVSCSYTYTTPECWYVVTGRFGNDASVQQRLFSQFERDEHGHLVEVVVAWTVRRR